MIFAPLLLVVFAQGPPATDPSVSSVSGRVADSGGHPVAGAEVLLSATGGGEGRSIWLVRTRCDAEGRFRLAGVGVPPSFLFVRAEGYGFLGRPLGPGEDQVTLALERRGGPPAVALATLPPALPHGEELELARRVLEPYATAVLKSSKEEDKIRVVEALARTEPARVLELLERGTFTQPFFDLMFRMRVVESLRGDSPDEAAAVAESIKDSAARAMALVKTSDALPPAERARQLELLARAVVPARAATDPAFKVLALAQIGERWLDLGERAKGEALLREGQALAVALPTAAFAGYSRGNFAEELAQIDLPAALELTRDLSEPREFDRHHGNIAHELAGRDPAEADRVLAMVRDRHQRDHYAVRVAYRMGPLDLPRARRLATAIDDPSLRGYALGMVALHLIETGANRKAEAATVLEEAFATLEQAAAGKPPERSLYRAGPVAAVLLPVAERIDQQGLAEWFWRALALRSASAAQSDIALALLLARYDRTVARSLLEPLVGPGGPVSLRSAPNGLRFVAASAIEPRWGVELAEAMPDNPDFDPHGRKNGARLALAQALARRGETRWRYLVHHHLYLWVPDTEDLGTDL
jgi:hypothetical protein